MAGDTFLKLSGIPGESTDEKHKDWIEVLSWNWGLSNDLLPTLEGSGSSTPGKIKPPSVVVRDISITKTADRATALLMMRVVNGQHIAEGKIEACRATGEKQKYLELSGLHQQPVKSLMSFLIHFLAIQ